MAVYRVTSPSGEVFRVTAPEGASEAQVMAYAKSNMTPKPKAAAKPRSVAQEFGRGARAVAGGIASLGDLAVMAANTPAHIGHALGGTPYAAPTPFGDMVARAFNAMGVGEPENDTDRMNAALIGGAASALPFLATGGASAAPTVARLVTEGVAGGASGVAGELARLGGAGELGQLAAALGGGLAGGMGAAGVARRVGAPAVPVRSAAERVAAARLRQSMADPERAMSRLDAYGASVVPGVRPTLAEATGDQGVIGLSRSMRNTARTGAGITQSMGDNTLARTSFIDDTFGAGSVDALNEAAAVALEGRGARVADALGRVGDNVPPEVAGMQARDKLAAASAATKGRASALYDNLPEVEGPLQVGPVDPFGASLPERVANPERAAFEQAARAGLKAGDSSNKATGGLASFIVSHGGIKPSEMEQGFKNRLPGVGDLYSAGINPKSRPGLFSQKGESLDNLLTAAQEAGFFPDNDPNLPNALTPNDLVQALIDDVNGRPVYRLDDMRGVDRAAANEVSDYWGRMFQRADMSPDKMTDADWDNLYRDAQDLPPHVVTEADGIAAAGDGVGRPISPAQSSLINIRNRFMVGEPMGNSGVDALVRKFVEADKMSAPEVEMIARQLREQAGFNYGKPQGAYATAAANSVDAFMRAASPPERLGALKQAQAAWREWASTFNQAGTPIATALRKDFGTYRQPDSTVGATLVPSGRKGAEFGGRLEKAIGSDAETLARTELRGAIDAAGERGADIRKVQAKYADTLRAYPALKADVDAAVDTAALADAFRMSPMGKLADPTANASKVIGSVIQNGDARGFKQIAAFARNPEARAGLRRSMANYVAKMSERGGGVAGADDAAGMTELQHIGNTIKALDNVLSISGGTNALEPAQVAALNAVKGELSRANAAMRLNPPVGSNTSRDAKGLADLATSTVMDEIGKYTPGVTTASAIMRVMKAARMGKAEDILVQALIDPVIARRLLSRASESNVRGTLSMIAARQSVLANAPVSTVAANDVGAIGASAAAQEDDSQK